MQAEPRRRHAGPHGDRELAAGADVEPQVVVADPARHLGAEEGLAGVVDVGAAAEIGEDLGVGVAEVAGPGAEVGLVEDVGGGAELACEVVDGHATDRQRAVRAAPDGRGPQRTGSAR